MNAGAAAMLEEANLSAESLAETVARLFADRAQLARMGEAAKALSHPDAAKDVAKMAAELAMSRSDSISSAPAKHAKPKT